MVRRSLFALAVLYGGSAFAQDWEVFDMAGAGLPSNTITALIEDEDGVIWVGTDWGLCSYNGDTWSVIQQQPDGLPDNTITSLAVDSTGRLWVGTLNAGIGILEDGTWTYLNGTNSPVFTDGVKHIHHDHRGWVWISTEAGLHCYTGLEWRLYNDQETSYGGFTFFGPNVKAVDVREDGLVCIATMNAGLTYLNETEFIYYTSFSSGFPDNSMNAVEVDANGDRWLACPSGGLIWHATSFIGGPWFQYNSFTAGFPDNTLLCLIIDGQGRKLTGSETAGVIVFEGGGTFQTWNSANSGLPDDHVRCLLEDSNGRIWAGTNEGGLARRISTTSLADTPPSEALKLYPNPASSTVWIDLGHDVWAADWSLLDLAGRMIQEGRSNGGGQVMVDVGDVTPGLYIASVSIAGNQRSALLRVE